MGLNDARALEDIGNAYKKIGRLVPAERALRRAFAKRESPDILLSLGEILALQNRFEDALGQYQAILSMSGVDSKIKRSAAKGCKAMRASLGENTKK